MGKKGGGDEGRKGGGEEGRKGGGEERRRGGEEEGRREEGRRGGGEEGGILCTRPAANEALMDYRALDRHNVRKDRRSLSRQLPISMYVCTMCAPNRH